MKNQDKERILKYMNEFLVTKSDFWYPECIINYKLQSSYESNYRGILRDVYYANFIVQDFLLNICTDFSENNNSLNFVFNYKDKKGKTELPTKNIFNIIKKINNAKIKKKLRNESGLFYYGKVNFNEKLMNFEANIFNKRLKSLKIYPEDKDSIFKNDENYNFNWFCTILNKLFVKECNIDFDYNKDNFILNVYKNISEISIDSSSEDIPHYFRWREEKLYKECDNCKKISQNKVEEILKLNRITIPENFYLSFIMPDGEKTSRPFLLVKYNHILNDNDYEEGNISTDKTSDIYRNKKKIIVEGDACIFFINPKKKLVLSQYIKNRPVEKIFK